MDKAGIWRRIVWWRVYGSMSAGRDRFGVEQRKRKIKRKDHGSECRRSRQNMVQLMVGFLIGATGMCRRGGFLFSRDFLLLGSSAAGTGILLHGNLFFREAAGIGCSWPVFFTIVLHLAPAAEIGEARVRTEMRCKAEAGGSGEEYQQQEYGDHAAHYPAK